MRRWPGESGFSLAEYIVKCPEFPLPIMMLTSVAQGEGVERCSALGLSVYVVKPVSESDLFDAMMSIRGAQSESVLEASADKQETTGRLHILVAEDNSVNQEVAQLMLQKRGYSVTIASNGREAVKLIAESAEFDIILMDIQMPEMDGFHATAAIREIESKGKRRTPIVAMTAHAMKGDRERCLEAGMDGYVSKPVQSKVLYETIEAMTRPAVPAQSLSHPPVPPITTPVARDAVNLDEILERLGGNVGLLQSIVSLFDEDCPGQMASDSGCNQGERCRRAGYSRTYIEGIAAGSLGGSGVGCCAGTREDGPGVKTPWSSRVVRNIGIGSCCGWK